MTSSRSSSLIVSGGAAVGAGAAGTGTREGDQNSLFFDDVDFWRGGGGWGSSVGYDDDDDDDDEVEHVVDGYYGGGGSAVDSSEGGRRGARKLRKKKKSRRKMQRGGSGRLGRSNSSGSFGFGGGTRGTTNSIMSELSVGDIAMMEAGIIRETSTKGGRTGSRRMRRDYSSNSINSDHRWRRAAATAGLGAGGGYKRRKTLSLPPTLPEVLRLSSGLLSVVSFASLSNLYNNLSNGGNRNNNHNHNNDDAAAMEDLEDDGSKEVHVRTTTAGGGGGPRRPTHRRTTSNAWIDEDAIHGPAVRVGGGAHAGGKSKGKGKGKGRDNKGKGGGGGLLSSPVGGGGGRKGLWRRSIRESWPLRTMISPTLPKLSSPWGSPLFGSPRPGVGVGGGGLSESSTMRSASGTLHSRYHYYGEDYHHREGIASFRFPDQPILAPPPRGDDNNSRALNYSPPRQLPKPPRQALLAASVESAGDSPLGYGYYRGSNWTTGTARTMMAINNNITPSRTASGRSVSGTSVGRSVSGASSERGLLSGYYRYEETNEPLVLPNPYHYPTAAVASKSDGGGGGGSFVSGTVAGSNGPPGIAITTPRESVVPAPLRLSSADSTLSGILRDTEKRLLDGTVTGVVARRNQRISISPSKRTLGASLSGPLRPGSVNLGSGGGGGGGNEHIATLMITSAGGVRAAPSPASPSPAASPSRAPLHRASGHARGDSQASMVSEADSLFAAPSPVQDHFHALTSPVKNGGVGVGLSPSGPPPQHPVPPLPLARHNSFNGSLSSSGSSLPTIYSVDENADGDADDTRITAFGSSTSEGLNRLAGFVSSKSSSNTLDDPFVVNWPPAAATTATTTTTTTTRTTPSPTRPATSGRRCGGAQPAPSRSVPDFSQGPRLYGGLTSRGEASLRSDSPLGAISGNSSRADDSRTRVLEPPPRSESRIPRAQARQPPSQSQQRNMVLLAAPTSSFNTTSGERRHEQANHRLDRRGGNDEPNFVVHSSTIPNIFLTTPSDKGESPLPRHVEALRTQASSPTLGRGREDTPELAVPSPAALSKKPSNLSSVYDYYMDIPLHEHHPALSPHRRAAAGEARKVSATTSSSVYSAADPRQFERDKERALDELNKLIRSERVGEGRSPRPVSTPAMGTTASASANANANANSVRLVPPEWLSTHMLANKPQHPTPSHPRTHHSQELLHPQYHQERRQQQHQSQSQNQSQNPNAKQQSLIPVSSTVAQLRRMNSQVSSYSNAASGYSDGSSSAPFLPTLIPGTTPLVSPPRNRRDSARNYFAMDSPPKKMALDDKENKATHAGATATSSLSSSSSSLLFRSGGPGGATQSHHGSSRLPKLEIPGGPETPKKTRGGRHSNERMRVSEDSLGLYDVDGFWISSSSMSSPERKSGSGSGFRL